MSKAFREKLERLHSKETRIKDLKRDKANSHELIRQARRNKVAFRNMFNVPMNEKPLAGE